MPVPSLAILFRDLAQLAQPGAEAQSIKSTCAL